MILKLVVFCIICICLSTALPSQYAHRAVIENAAVEATYPEYFKNPFYKTPRVRDALARYSWFANGEMPVIERAAERISRREIYNVLSHAGLIPRRF